MGTKLSYIGGWHKNCQWTEKQSGTMIGENRQLVADEPVEFEK